MPIIHYIRGYAWMGVTFFKSNLLTAEDVAYPLTERALFAMVYDIYATSCVFSIKNTQVRLNHIPSQILRDSFYHMFYQAFC